MSEVLDTCEEQYLSIWQLLRLLITEGIGGNLYINMCNSGLDPEDLLQLNCDDFYPLSGFLRQTVVEDADGNPCIQFVSTDNPFSCSNLLNFEFTCNSQYLTII